MKCSNSFSHKKMIELSRLKAINWMRVESIDLPIHCGPYRRRRCRDYRPCLLLRWEWSTRKRSTTPTTSERWRWAQRWARDWCATSCAVSPVRLRSWAIPFRPSRGWLRADPRRISNGRDRCGRWTWSECGRPPAAITGFRTGNLIQSNQIKTKMSSISCQRRR